MQNTPSSRTGPASKRPASNRPPARKERVLTTLSAPVKPVVPDAPPPLPPQREKPQSSDKRSRRKPLLDLNQWMLMGLYTATLIGFWTFLDWPSDLFCHFRAQYAALFVIALGITLIRKQPMWAVLAVTGLCLNLTELWPAHFVKPAFTELPALSAVQARVKVMQMNVLLSNQNYEQANNAILEMDPDILSLQEVDSNWLEALSPALRRYPYHISAISDTTTTGIADTTSSAYAAADAVGPDADPDGRPGYFVGDARGHRHRRFQCRQGRHASCVCAVDHRQRRRALRRDHRHRGHRAAAAFTIDVARRG